MSTNTERKAFKDWFDADAAHRLGVQMRAAWAEFPLKRFEKRAARGLEGLEFHGRVHQFAAALGECLPDDLSEALAILTRSLPPVNPDNEPMNDGWLQWPLGHFIAERGLAEFDAAFRAMIALTQRFSSEFAVRPFVEHRPTETFAALLKLTSHASPHVRRWCSEGIRPRLPWGNRLHALVRDPSPLWPILEALKDDSSLYVRKSVANCINDIAKDHPELVLDRCEVWQQDAGEARQWIIRHGLRSLIKDGHPRALALMGYQTDPPVKAVPKLERDSCRIGETVTLEAGLSNAAAAPQALLLDLVVSFPGKNGALREKVFKWTTLTLAPGEKRTLRKTLPFFRPSSVRALYPGDHFIELQLNGCRKGRARLRLEEDLNV
ncbi:MAG: DNA alkylation repair protein [Verrucomicrobia bacterium]|nr:DNA alkylation repair protein [Verrucomicrobiota bacterium]MCH8528356.1 DNA alkylation repair protein [Kiritimatiellia bacterium]